VNLILADLERLGRPVTLAEYLELALYHPEHGYYTRSRTSHGPVGPEGDFITAPTASPIFARTLAVMLRRLAAEVGAPLSFAELGAGEGNTVAAILRELGPDRARTLGRVAAVERSGPARKTLVQRCRAEGWSNLETAASLEELAPAAGPTVLFASELYDALPCHLVTATERDGGAALQEMFVTLSPAGELSWQPGEPSTPELGAYLDRHGVSLLPGQLAEVRPGLEELHRRHLAWCGPEAVAVTLDYGHATRSLYNARGRPRGTLVGYRAHRLHTDVLQDPGTMDITAHVNFDDLAAAAASLGWSSQRLEPLGMFLARHGALELLPAPGPDEPPSAALREELQAARHLLLPDMGSDLKVLAQGAGRIWEGYVRISSPR
jgi:SAM-dependent MidA family methyltransferase